MSNYSDNHMIVSSSDWTDYNDSIPYSESKYYRMISNGCFVSIRKPCNVETEYGDERVVVNITNESEP